MFKTNFTCAPVARPQVVFDSNIIIINEINSQFHVGVVINETILLNNIHLSETKMQTSYLYDQHFHGFVYSELHAVLRLGKKQRNIIAF